MTRLNLIQQTQWALAIENWWTGATTAAQARASLSVPSNVEVVHSSWNETVSGNKTFTDNVQLDTAIVYTHEWYQIWWRDVATNSITRAKAYADAWANFIVETGSTPTERIRVNADGILVSWKIETSVAIKYNNWTQWLGKVLTSDAAGNATWSSPSGSSVIWASIRPTNPVQLNTSLTPISCDIELWDTNWLHSSSVNPTRITVPSDGIYTIGLSCTVISTTSSTDYAYVLFVKNWVTTIWECRTSPFQFWVWWAYANVSFSTPVQLSANDYIEVHMLKSSASTIMQVANTNYDFAFFVKS